MKSLEAIAVVLFLPFVSAAEAEVKTDLTIDSLQVVAMGDKWEITVSGKVSLAKDDTLKSYSFFFTDPAGKGVAPTFRPFYPPKPGETFTYTVFCTTHVQGGWSFGGEITYKIGGKKSDKASKMEKFNVPQK